VVAISVVALPEALASIARRRREGDLREADADQARDDLLRDVDTFLIVETTLPLARRAGVLAESRKLRGSDAIHLASALATAERFGRQTVIFGSDDRQLRSTARLELLEVLVAPGDA
jgi:predicted nucleic acid-binding protein